MSIGRIATFLLVLFGVSALLHRYLWLRFVRDAALPAPWFRTATVLLVLLAIALPLAIPLTRVLPRSVATPVMWAAFLWMGVSFFLVVLLGATDLGWLLARPALADATPERRRFLSRVVGMGVNVTALGLGAFGVATVLGKTAVRRVRVPLAKLPPALSGFTIVQLTDLHVGATIGRDYVERIVGQVNALKPDLVAITGDLVDGSVAELAAHVAPLARLQAKHGVYFVTGNHEYYSGADAWLRHLATLGIRPLRNERVSIGGAGGFDLGGVDDWTAHQFGGGHGMDLAKVVAGRDPARALVLLAHQPKAIDAAADAGVDLQLSGHTHGGQLVPFNLIVALAQPYVAGLHRHRDTHIYVSRGTGYWGPPMRVGAPAEITRLELVAPAEAAAA